MFDMFTLGTMCKVISTKITAGRLKYNMSCKLMLTSLYGQEGHAL